MPRRYDSDSSSLMLAWRKNVLHQEFSIRSNLPHCVNRVAWWSREFSLANPFLDALLPRTGFLTALSIRCWLKEFCEVNSLVAF